MSAPAGKPGTGFAATVQHAWGVNPAQICFIDEATICMSCANGVVLWAPNTNRQSHIWLDGRGVSALAVSRPDRVIAAAVEHLPPVVALFSYPDRQPIATLPVPPTDQGKDVTITALAFSRDRGLLAAATGLPSFRLLVWDWHQRTLVASAALDGPCETLSFNPRVSGQLCTTGARTRLWRMETLLDRPQLSSSDLALPEAADAVQCHCWSTEGHLFLGTAGGVLRWRGEGEPTRVDLPPAAAGASVTALLLGRGHLLVGTATGVVAWVPLSPAAPVHVVQAGPGTVAHLEFEPDFAALAVSLSTGSVLSVPLDRTLLPAADAAPSTICDFHTTRVTGLDALPQRRIATCALDGTLRIWSLSQRRLLHTVAEVAPLTALAAAPPALPAMVAVGDALGVVRVFATPATGAPVLLWRQRYHSAGVTALAWDPHGRLLVTGSADGQVSFTAVDARGAAGGPMGGLGPVDGGGGAPRLLRALGMCTVAAEVLGLSWDAAGAQLFVLLMGGTIIRLSPPPAGHTPDDGLQLSPQLLAMVPMRASVTLTALAAPVTAARKDVSFFALGADKRLKTYRMAQGDDADGGDDADLMPPEAEVDVLEKPGAAIAMGPGGRALAVAGPCGTLALAPTAAPDAFSTARCHAPSTGGLVKVCFGADGQSVVTAGADGTLLLWQLNPSDPPAVPAAAPADVNLLEPVDDAPSDASEALFVDVLRAERRRAQQLLSEAGKQRMREHLAQLKARLGELIVQNESAPELERLTRADFLLDTELRDSIERSGDQQVSAVRESVKFENLARDMLWEKIKAECYDTMEVHGVLLRGFRPTTPVVQNFPLRKLTPAEAARAARIRFLRRMELALGGARRVDLHNTHHFDLNLAPVPGLSVAAGDSAAAAAPGGAGAVGKPSGGTATTTTAKPAAKAAAQPAAGAAAGDDSDPDDSGAAGGARPGGGGGGAVGEAARGGAVADDAASLLYRTLDLSTRRARIVQMHLLSAVARSLRESFNREFDALVSRKHDTIGKIDERRERLAQIAAELAMLHPDYVPDESALVPKPSFAPDEVADTVLKVSDDEVPVEKFISPAERARLEEEKRKEAERLARARGDDIGERGLELMMGGKLESATEEKPLLQVLVRPAELNKPQDEMTEDELRLLREFQKKEQALAEEREKMRKSLLAEQKKLVDQIAELQKSFDERVALLFQAQLQVKQQVYEVELRAIKCAQAVQRAEDDEATIAEMDRNLKSLSSRSASSAALLQDIKRKLDAAQEALTAQQNEQRAHDKILRKEFKKDELMELQRRWKQRPPEDDPMATRESLDPYAQSTATAESSAFDVGDDGAGRVRAPITEEQWQRFVARMKERQPLDASVARLKTTADELQAYYERVAAADARNQKAQAELTAAREQLVQDLQEDLLNHDCVMRLKQGQVEVTQAAVVPEYDQALMLPRTEVEDLNGIIVAKGKRKVALLQSIKKLNSAINALEWQLEERQLQADDLKLENQQLQLLRVTKELQENIKGGAQQRQQKELKLLQMKAEHSEKTHELKITERRKLLAALQRQMRERAEENVSLDTQLQQLQLTVAERQTIHGIQASRTGDLGGTERKTRELATRRKLQDISRAQAEEIAFLREELDRLRQRTFPSFQRVTRPGI